MKSKIGPSRDEKTALVLGAGGFIGSHMVKRLKSDGFFVVAADLKMPEFSISLADDFQIGDLREVKFVSTMINFIDRPFDQVYQFAADMGGAGFVFSSLKYFTQAVLVCTRSTTKWTPQIQT